MQLGNSRHLARAPCVGVRGLPWGILVIRMGVIRGIWGDMDSRLLFKGFNVTSSEIDLRDTVLYRESRDVPLCPHADQLLFRDRGRELLDSLSARSRVHGMYMYSVITSDERGSGEDPSHSEYMLS